jgi:hypothetical protein
MPQVVYLSRESGAICAARLVLTRLFSLVGQTAQCGSLEMKKTNNLGECDIMQAKPSQAKPSQAKPSQAKPSQAKPFRTFSLRD